MQNATTKDCLGHSVVLSKVESYALLCTREVDRICAASNVSNHDITEVDHIIVIVVAACHGIIAAPDEAIVAIAAIQGVGAAASDQQVCQRASGEDVISSSAIKHGS